MPWLMAEDGEAVSAHELVPAPVVFSDTLVMCWGELHVGMVLAMEEAGESVVGFLLVTLEDLSSSGWEFEGLVDGIW